MIWLDRSRGSIVCGCTRCPHVRELATDPARADAWVSAHAAMHAADDDARRAVTAARARRHRRDTPSS